MKCRVVLAEQRVFYADVETPDRFGIDVHAMGRAMCRSLFDAWNSGELPSEHGEVQEVLLKYVLEDGEYDSGWEDYYPAPRSEDEE